MVIEIIVGTIVLAFVGTALGAIIECFDGEPEQLDEHETMHYHIDDTRDHRI